MWTMDSQDKPSERGMHTFLMPLIQSLNHYYKEGECMN